MPTVFLVARREDVEGDAAANLRILDRLPVTVHEISDSKAWRGQADTRVSQLASSVH